jgi:hypothetical protein
MSGFTKFKIVVSHWWHGEFVAYGPPIVGGHIRRHWTADVAHACWSYFKEHHRWIIGTVVIGRPRSSSPRCIDD